jgi:diadenosine tetraphosphate (Ap4A) HIT family hydrolase
VIPSRRDCTDGRGKHYIFQIKDSSGDETPEEEAELWALVRSLATKLFAPSSRWRVLYNALDLRQGRNTHVHFHLVWVPGDMEVVRLTDPIAKGPAPTPA